jgi:membrane protease YdiL (CAAX protease family)
MSTAPSSIPPPSFGVAPELPEGVERPPRPESPRWKPWMAWAALVAAFAGALVGALVIGVIGSAAGSSFTDPSPAVSDVALIVQDLSFIGAALLFANISSRPLPEQFGLRPTRFWPAVGWMAAAFAAFYAFTLVWVAILGVSPDDTKLPDELGVKDSTYALLAVAFLVTVVAPIAEEFFFRGFFFGALRNWKGLWPAALLTGLVFGAIHVGSAEAAFLLPLGFFGFCLCLLRERTGSLYPGIALHCMNNSLAFGVSQHWGWEIVVLFVCALGVIALVALTVRARWTPAPMPTG